MHTHRRQGFILASRALSPQEAVSAVSADYANRTFWAMQIARDVEACSALMRGEPVDPARLRLGWVEFAAAFQLVRLDLYAIDLLQRRVELRALLRETA